MLIEAFPGYSEELEGALKRRVRYLSVRAQSLQFRPIGSPTLEWQPLVIEATLWLEAAEATVALGAYSRARGFLFSGARALLQAGLPLGAALQKILLPAANDLTPLSDAILETWRRGLEAARRFEAVPDQDRFPLIEVAQDTSQQRAYFDLAESLSREKLRIDPPYADFPPDAATTGSAAVGRLGLPLDDYLMVATEGGDAVRGIRLVDEPSRERAVNNVLTSSIRKLYRILEESSKNRYLWTRMLAPIPLFDLDTAMLFALATNARATKGSIDIRKALTGSTPGESEYAAQFMAAVEGLRRGEGERDARL